MFQLKMYMAISGRAPERGLPAHRRQPPTPIQPLPVQEVSAVHVLPHISLNKRRTPLGCHRMPPLRAGTQISGMVWCKAAFLRPGATTLSACLPTPFLVWVEVDVEGQGASFTS